MTKLNPSQVRWVDEVSGSLAGALPVVWLRVSSIIDVGDAFYEREDNGSADQTVTLFGQRDFTLSIRIESFTSDISDQRAAANLGNAIMTRLWRTPAILQRSGLFAIREYLSTNWLNYVESGRPISTYVIDLLCATVDVDVDDTPHTGFWIGEVQGSGPIKQNDGSTVDTVNYDVKAD